MSNAPLLDRARSSTIYRELGWSVIPVDADTKRPLVFWKPFSKKPAGLDEIDSWGRRFPKGGIAVITGKVSGIIVLDADGEAGVREALSRGIPRTPTVSTPRGGAHFYFKAPDFLVGNGAKMGSSKRIDVRGESGYVLAPHSRRADGKRYVWGAHPATTPLADPPAWFLEMLKSRPAIRETLSNSSSKEIEVDLQELLDSLPDRLHQLILEGSHAQKGFRSEYDYEVVLQLILRGVSNEAIEEVFQTCLIGEKYREQGQGSRYLGLTIDKARQKVRTVRIKYADLNSYDGGRKRLHLALIVEDAPDAGRLIRCGLTVPGGDSEAVSVRWGHFFGAVGVPAPIGKAVEGTVKGLVGRAMRVELDTSRENPVAAFHRLVK
jgi:hypothetical protein